MAACNRKLIWNNLDLGLYIRYFIPSSSFKTRSLIFHSPWRSPVLTFVPLCCSMQQICGFRWNFIYIPSAMSGLSVYGFTSAILISGWTRIELHRAMLLYQQRLLRHPQKQIQPRWTCLQRWFTPFDSIYLFNFLIWSPSLSHFLQKSSTSHSLPVT